MTVLRVSPEDELDTLDRVLEIVVVLLLMTVTIGETKRGVETADPDSAEPLGISVVATLVPKGEGPPVAVAACVSPSV